MKSSELLEVAERVLADAKPGEEMEVVASWSLDTEVRAYGGEVEHLVSADSAGVGVRILVDGRQGTAWVGGLEEASLRACVADARDNTRFASPDPFAGLAVPDGHPIEGLELFDDRLLAESTESKIALALDLERRIMERDPRIVGIESADYADSISAGAIVSTTGIRAFSSETSTYLGAYVLAGDDAETTSGFGFSVGRRGEDLSAETAATDAVEKAIAALGATKVPSQRLTVVFDPYVTSQFISLVAEMLAGDAVIRGRSPFADRLGDQVSSSLLTLFDDAINPLSPTSSEIDGEGLACRRVPLIDAGVLAGFMHNSYSARSAGAVSTGSAQRSSLQSPPSVGPFVITATPGERTHGDIVAAVGEGVLVRELSGLHSGVNTISGDLSVGIEGLMIRGGEPAESVAEVTVASTIQRMLNDIVMIGSDLTYFPWEATGVTMAIGDMALSGK
ncbi:MAG: TldD/PmbA family protein [Microthrixaceae bacterium]